MGEEQRKVDWFAVTVNAFMWSVALFIVWTQVAGWDSVMSRFLACIGVLGVIVGWCIAVLMRLPLRRTWMHFACSVALLSSTLFFNFPMRASFSAIRGTMNGLADSVERGQAFDSPFRVGPHVIEKGEMWGPMTCFWTGSTPGGKVGYCRLREGDPAEHINEWSIVDLGGGWYHIVED